MVFLAGCAPTNPYTMEDRIGDARQNALRWAATLALEGADVHAQLGDDEMMALARASIRESLADPESARFRREKVVAYDDGVLVCGEMNAKNRFGGYVGYDLYISSGYRAEFWQESEISPEAANAGILAACS
jgi:hypothetical protein